MALTTAALAKPGGLGLLDAPSPRGIACMGNRQNGTKWQFVMHGIALWAPLPALQPTY